MEKSRKKLGELLVEDGILTHEDLQTALEHQKTQGGMIGQVFVRLGLITEENLIAALGRQLKLPYLPLSNYAVNLEAVQALEERFSRLHMMLMFDRDERHAFIAVSDPVDETTIEELEKKVKLKAQIFLSLPTEILHMLDMAFSTASGKNLKKAS